MSKKPYADILIVESGDLLVPISMDVFECANPHPYAVLGAPYDGVSPFFVRQDVLTSLQTAQMLLQLQRPTWKLYFRCVPPRGSPAIYGGLYL
jgi:zinc D-Ala-D-Ala dipeptidase